MAAECLSLAGGGMYLGWLADPSKPVEVIEKVESSSVAA